MQGVIGSHIRSMQADHLTDVPTSDQHTVKPWLSARLDVSPPVRDLKDAGFPLVGGRLDYVDGHQAAAVVYRHAKHVINLFAWSSPGSADEPLHAESRQGFNVVTWRRGGITYYTVSDVEADQLSDFAHLVAQGD
jgi:anti-sigma factor RsiW